MKGDISQTRTVPERCENKHYLSNISQHLHYVSDESAPFRGAGPLTKIVLGSRNLAFGSFRPFSHARISPARTPEIPLPSPPVATLHGAFPHHPTPLTTDKPCSRRAWKDHVTRRFNASSARTEKVCGAAASLRHLPLAIS